MTPPIMSVSLETMRGAKAGEKESVVTRSVAMPIASMEAFRQALASSEDGRMRSDLWEDGVGKWVVVLDNVEGSLKVSLECHGLLDGISSLAIQDIEIRVPEHDIDILVAQTFPVRGDLLYEQDTAMENVYEIVQVPKVMDLSDLHDSFTIEAAWRYITASITRGILWQCDWDSTTIKARSPDLTDRHGCVWSVSTMKDALGQLKAFVRLVRWPLAASGVFVGVSFLLMTRSPNGDYTERVSYYGPYEWHAITSRIIGVTVPPLTTLDKWLELGDVQLFVEIECRIVAYPTAHLVMGDTTTARIGSDPLSASVLARLPPMGPIRRPPTRLQAHLMAGQVVAMSLPFTTDGKSYWTLAVVEQGEAFRLLLCANYVPLRGAVVRAVIQLFRQGQELERFALQESWSPRDDDPTPSLGTTLPSLEPGEWFQLQHLHVEELAHRGPIRWELPPLPILRQQIEWYGTLRSGFFVSVPGGKCCLHVGKTDQTLDIRVLMVDMLSDGEGIGFDLTIHIEDREHDECLYRALHVMDVSQRREDLLVTTDRCYTANPVLVCLGDEPLAIMVTFRPRLILGRGPPTFRRTAVGLFVDTSKGPVVFLSNSSCVYWFKDANTQAEFAVHMRYAPWTGGLPGDVLQVGLELVRVPTRRLLLHKAHILWDCEGDNPIMQSASLEGRRLPLRCGMLHWFAPSRLSRTDRENIVRRAAGVLDVDGMFAYRMCVDVITECSEPPVAPEETIDLDALARAIEASSFKPRRKKPTKPRIKAAVPAPEPQHDAPAEAPLEPNPEAPLEPNPEANQPVEDVEEEEGGHANEEDAFLQAFFCPITTTLLRDPVVAGDGMTYEREAIEEWIERETIKGKWPVSPMTGAPLPRPLVLVPNTALRQCLEQYRERVA